MACELLQVDRKELSTVTNFAANILQNLTMAGNGRANYARQCVAEFDRNGDGSVSAMEFQHIFASLKRIEEMTSGATTSFVSSGCRPTLFEATMFPSYSNAYAASCYQAAAMLGGLDTDGDHAVSMAEWVADKSSTSEETQSPETDPADSGTDNPPAPPTPDERAMELLTTYDATGKGYITIDDLVSKWIADPSLGNIAEAGNAIEAWDADGDGKVTRADIVSAYEVMDAADTVLAALGDPATGKVELAGFARDKLAALELTEQQVKGWDADRDGALSRNEVIDGIKRLRIETATDAEKAAFAKLVAKFDTDGSGGIGRAELAGALGSLTLDETALEGTFAAWDVNGDNAIDASELQTGYQAIKDAQTVVAAYDIDGKGYFDEADLQRAIDENGSAEGQGSAHDILLAWDRDGDGKVSVQDVMTMKQALAQAEAAVVQTVSGTDTTI